MHDVVGRQDRGHDDVDRLRAGVARANVFESQLVAPKLPLNVVGVTFANSCMSGSPWPRAAYAVLLAGVRLHVLREAGSAP